MAKTKALISCAVTAKSLFSHNEAPTFLGVSERPKVGHTDDFSITRAMVATTGVKYLEIKHGQPSESDEIVNTDNI